MTNLTGFALLSAALLYAGQGLASGEAALATHSRKLDAVAETQPVSARLASDFAVFAGSRANAEALINGLRLGTPIGLTDGVRVAATVAPPTRPMGYGNTFIALSLARAQLAQHGISRPTPAQLQAALTGGVLRIPNDGAVALTGVLNQRVSGMGWGRIAQESGVKLGSVIDGLKSASTHWPAVADPAHVSSASAAATPLGASEFRTRHASYSTRGITTALSGGGVIYGNRGRADAPVAGMDKHARSVQARTAGVAAATGNVAATRGNVSGVSTDAPGRLGPK